MRKMMTSCLAALILISSSAFADRPEGLHEKLPYSFSITKHIYKFSESYQITSRQRETYPGTVKKSAFRIRTNYDLSDEHGWQATGITRVLSLGSLYSWATNIDIYDTRGVQVGLIEGNLATFESAKFSLYEYDDLGNAYDVGVAYASNNFNHFAILRSTSDPRPLAEFTRNFSDNSWYVTVSDPSKIDDRLVRIFAGFVIDYQDKWAEQRQEVKPEQK